MTLILLLNTVGVSACGVIVGRLLSGSLEVRAGVGQSSEVWVIEGCVSEEASGVLDSDTRGTLPGMLRLCVTFGGRSEGVLCL